MKNKKGFTLIELLAVIVILAIIALIAVPVIMNIINKANKSAFKDTAYGVISAGELYFAEQQLDLNGMKEKAEFTFPTDAIEVKGNVPDGTVLHVNTKGQTALAMSNGRYCITKRYDDNDITVTEDSGDCYFPYNLGAIATKSEELGVTEINDCVEKGKVCTVSKTDPIAFAIKVNSKETYKFYVLSDDGDTITLIMNQNLYADGNNNPNVAWVSKLDYNDDVNYGTYGKNNKGPITAINALIERTSDWDYIESKPYTYKGIADDETTKKYEDKTITMKARMLTYAEATSDAIGCQQYTATCPNWLHENLYTTGDTNTYGYWTSTARASGDVGAFHITVYNDGSGDIYAASVYTEYYGIRPVIEISK